MPSVIDRELDELYSLPLSRFTAARNALASKVAKGGERAAASEIRELAKPSVSAWAVNQLVRQHRAAVKAMLEKGERARSAQAKALSGGDASELRERLGDLRDALLDLRSRAASILREAGHAASDDTLERVATTLRTASQAPEAADLLVQGTLEEDLDPLGLAVLAAGPRAAATPARTRRTSRRSDQGEKPEGVRALRERIAQGLREGPRPVPARRRKGAQAPEPRQDARAERASAAAERSRVAAEQSRVAAERRKRQRAEAEERRERERTEAQRRRKVQAEIAKRESELARAEGADAKARLALESAEETLEEARRRVEIAHREREDTLAAAREARQELDLLKATEQDSVEPRATEPSPKRHPASARRRRPRTRGR